MKIKTNYLKLEVNNPNFELIHVISRINIIENQSRLIDYSKKIEVETKKKFLEDYKDRIDLSQKELLWYTQFHPKCYEALVIIMAK
jgi:hypothetical protein